MVAAADSNPVDNPIAEVPPCNPLISVPAADAAVSPNVLPKSLASTFKLKKDSDKFCAAPICDISAFFALISSACLDFSAAVSFAPVESTTSSRSSIA